MTDESRFKERGFFRRVGDMLVGFTRPRASREYKIACIELQRLAAPLTAIIVPSLVFVVLIVVTASHETAGGKEPVIELIPIDETLPPVDEPPPPDVPVQEPSDFDVSIVIDAPAVPTVEPAPAAPEPAPAAVSKVNAPNLVAVVSTPSPLRQLPFGSRNPAGIARATDGSAGGGSDATEATVLKALRWLKKTQRDDGGWEGPISNTGLAVLSYLAHGEYPGSPSVYTAEFGATVAKALMYLYRAEYADKDGVCRFKGEDGNEYSFLIVAYALAEAYGMTRNPNFKGVAERALGRIVAGQSPTGGWDYRLNRDSTRDDMSYEGWAIQALRAGKTAGIAVTGLDECVKKAMKCLRTRNFRDGGFNYTAGGAPTGLTATGCLCMQMFDGADKPEVAAALDYMRGWLPAFEPSKVPGGTPGANPQYYCYYAAQCKFLSALRPGAKPADREAWLRWNKAMKETYPSAMKVLDEKLLDAKGREVECGFWTNGDGGCKVAGDTMATCLCALQLMVYYRHALPTAAPPKDAEKAAGTAGSDDLGVKVDI